MIATPRWFSKIFPSYQWFIDNQNNEIYLTFDDGPTPNITEWILLKLEEYQAKATFFCIGKNVVLYPELYQEIIRQGHAVGNHTHNHLKGWGTSTSAYIQNVEKASEYIDSNLFRPPYGRIGVNQTRILKEKFKIIMWESLSFDYDRKISPKVCAKNVISTAKVGSIIVFHDSLKAEKNMKYGLEKSLEHFAAMEWKMVAIT